MICIDHEIVFGCSSQEGWGSGACGRYGRGERLYSNWCGNL